MTDALPTAYAWRTSAPGIVGRLAWASHDGDYAAAARALAASPDPLPMVAGLLAGILRPGVAAVADAADDEQAEALIDLAGESLRDWQYIVAEARHNGLNLDRLITLTEACRRSAMSPPSYRPTIIEPAGDRIAAAAERMEAAAERLRRVSRSILRDPEPAASGARRAAEAAEAAASAAERAV